MAKRKSIGVIFRKQAQNWTGGLYYILNLIHAINSLPDASKPLLIIFGDDEIYKMVQDSRYPYLKRSSELRKLNANSSVTILKRLINRVATKLFNQQFIEERLTPRDINVLFPIQSIDFEFYGDEWFRKKNMLALVPKLYWIPDFQEHYLPHFFSTQEIAARKANQSELSQQESIIIFSSEDARNDFLKFYPDARAKPKVLNFAVTHPFYADLDGQALKEKYALTQPYFFSPNQFWAHKNHIIILKSLQTLKERGQKLFTVAFSGKEYDYRNPDYFASLKTFVKENQLENYVKFLGFLDRGEQLKLMSEAVAVVQPSLFEGWSTVVEDAKAMNQFVIASDLNVHREQLTHNVLFFDPNNEKDLAEKISLFMSGVKKKVHTDYQQNVAKFAKDFISYVDLI